MNTDQQVQLNEMDASPQAMPGNPAAGAPTESTGAGTTDQKNNKRKIQATKETRQEKRLKKKHMSKAEKKSAIDAKRVMKLSKEQHEIRDEMVKEIGKRDQLTFAKLTNKAPENLVYQMTPGAAKFMEHWPGVEKNLFKCRAKNAIISTNKKEFARNYNRHKLSHPHLIQNAKEVLECDFPDINFNNLHQFFDMKEVKSLNDPFSSLLYENLNYFKDQMKLRDEGKPHVVINIVSLNESDNKKINFVLPKVVLETNVIRMINTAAESFIQKHPGTPRAKHYEEIKSKLMSVDKYVILSMAGSFMDIHIDMGGAAVYYYVWIGKKVFYVVEPTKKNVELYGEWEKKGGTKENQGEWIVRRMEGPVKRVEINAGTLALFPSGMLHFVYTPEDTVAFSGNMLTTDNIPLSFSVHKMDEECVQLGHVPEGVLFRGFWDTWFFFIDICVLGEKTVKIDKKMAEELYRELQNHVGDKKKSWFTIPKRKDILNGLAAMFWPEKPARSVKDFLKILDTEEIQEEEEETQSDDEE